MSTQRIRHRLAQDDVPYEIWGEYKNFPGASWDPTTRVAGTSSVITSHEVIFDIRDERRSFGFPRPKAMPTDRLRFNRHDVPKKLSFSGAPADKRRLAAFKPCYHGKMTIEYVVDPQSEVIMTVTNDPFTGYGMRFRGTCSVLLNEFLKNANHNGVTLPNLFMYDEEYWKTHYSATKVNDWSSPLSIQILRSLFTTITPAEVDKFNIRAWQKMFPRLSSSGFSIVNFIYELKDFKSLASSIVKGNALKDLSAYFLNRKNLTWSGFLQLKAELTLEYNFNYKQLFSDIQTIINKLHNSESVIRDYVKNGDGTPQSRRYGMDPLQAVNTLDFFKVFYRNEKHGYLPRIFDLDYVPHYDPKVIFFTPRHVSKGPQFHSTSMFKYSSPELKGFLNNICAYLDLFGANRNPAILWNAVPFTFVIDWFVHVSGYLDSLKVENFSDNHPTLLDYSFSERVTFTDDIIWDDKLIAHVTYDIYDRCKMVPPEGHGTLEVADFTMNKLQLGADLARCLSHRK